MARSINQNAYSGALPNFRNLGIALRIVVIVNLMALAAAILQASDVRRLWDALLELSAIVEPMLTRSPGCKSSGAVPRARPFSSVLEWLEPRCSR